MSARSVSVCLVLVSFVAGPSCGEGTDGAGVDVSPTTSPDEGGPSQACSSGQCVSATGDADRDGYAAKDDCDDGDPSVHPGAEELCNGKDDNCDGKIDEGFDADGDGWMSCVLGSKAADCDDADPLVNPGAQEVCNGKDDDCDGTIDEGFDADNDGFYTCARNGTPPDCDDRDATISPGASELCNGRDDDCDGLVDELPATLAGSLRTPIDPHWALAGTAAFIDGWAQLTPEQPWTAGALWWAGSYLFDSFDVTAIFWMAARTDCADGLAFAFVPGTNVTAIGEVADGYGVSGLGGHAVAIDTFRNAGEPLAPFLAVVDAQSKTHRIRQAIPEVRDGRTHELRVKLDDGKISVWLDSVSYIFEFPLPSYVPFSGRWGFTAGTGALTCPHRVRNVKMSFPEGQGCVP